jgi:hypothetical protein
MIAKDASSNPPIAEASGIETSITSLSNLGMTGMIIPNPVTSINNVTNIKPSAALRPEAMWRNLIRKENQFESKEKDIYRELTL